ncbi:MAG: DUF3298 domain-containing protein [Clostridia bacterium]|nr:DUF3298 domain-containing protein [Clostridia bacterium]
MKLKTEVRIKTLEESLKGKNGKEILHYKISFPVFYSDVFFRATSELNQHYFRRATNLKTFCKNAFFHMAQEAFRNGEKEPFRLYEEVSIPYSEDVHISLFFDRRVYSAGAHSPERAADTWDISGGNRRLLLGDLFSPRDAYEKKVLTEIERQIEVRKRKGEVFYEPTARCLRDSFSPRQFYLTKQGVSVFFQSYDIAPSEAGIPLFVIDYTQNGPSLFAAY